MNLNIFKRAFSLTELLIVMVIIGVLFAAMLPIMSGRRSGQTTANEEIWMYVNDDDQKDAFYDSAVPSFTSAAYIGVNPLNITDHKPFSKVVLKGAAAKNQNMIQFRTGNSIYGDYTGFFAIDGKGNLLNMTKGFGTVAENHNAIVARPENKNNTVMGPGAFSNIEKSSKVTSIGAMSTFGGNRDGSIAPSAIAIGRNSNIYARANESILIGANTGRSEQNRPENFIKDTIGIGAGVLSIPQSSGQDNVFLGYNVANVGFDSNEAKNNVILNSPYYGQDAKNTVILGSDGYSGGNPHAANMVAVGEYACASYSGKREINRNGRVTCIGYNSAGTFGAGSKTANAGWEKDPYDHLFIGGKPYTGMGGRSVLEIHNMPNTLPESQAPRVGPTVVLNSNLVVRGNTLFGSYESGELVALASGPVYTSMDAEKGSDRCGRRCGPFGRKKYRTSPSCKWFWAIISAIGFIGYVIAGLVSAGAGWVLGSWLVYATGAILQTLVDGNGYYRTRDPITGSALYMRDDMSCSGSSQTYPYENKNAVCPDLGLGLSDVRLKENIVQNDDAISKILLLQPYNYTYKNDATNTPQVGVMAQDLQKVFPNAVSEDKNGYLKIRWDEMFFATINSVKALDAQVESASSDLDAVESDVKDVSKEQKKIKKYIADVDERISKLENK